MCFKHLRALVSCSFPCLLLLVGILSSFLSSFGIPYYFLYILFFYINFIENHLYRNTPISCIYFQILSFYWGNTVLQHYIWFRGAGSHLLRYIVSHCVHHQSTSNLPTLTPHTLPTLTTPPPTPPSSPSSSLNSAIRFLDFVLVICYFFIIHM